MKERFITAAIIKIGAQGDGLATHHRLPVYVAKTAPGDMVNFALGKPKPEGYAGTLQRIITPSKHRVEPPCPYFQRCGGCALQHVNEPFYREWKINRVRHALLRADVEYGAWEEPVFLPAATRRRTTLAALRTRSNEILGYNEARSHTIVDTRSCLVLEPGLDGKVQLLRPFLKRILPEGKACDITLQQAGGALDVILTGPLQQKGRFTLEQDEAFGEMMDALGISRLSWRARDFVPADIILARAPVVKKFGAIGVSLPPGAFLQASDAGEEALVGTVTGYAEGARTIADLFSGCGTFAGSLLETGAAVTAIEGDAAAVRALAAAGHPRLAAQRRDLFKNPLDERELEAFDTVIFDPPRAGASAQAEKMAFSAVPRIIGVSCNPSTFARDAKILQDGGYRLESLTMVDQFVWSAHVEIAGLFVKA